MFFSTLGRRLSSVVGVREANEEIDAPPLLPEGTALRRAPGEAGRRRSGPSTPAAWAAARKAFATPIAIDRIEIAHQDDRRFLINFAEPADQWRAGFLGGESTRFERAQGRAAWMAGPSAIGSEERHADLDQIGAGLRQAVEHGLAKVAASGSPHVMIGDETGPALTPSSIAKQLAAMRLTARSPAAPP